MEFYFSNLNNVKGQENNTLNRNTIKRIKKLLAFQNEAYVSLRHKFNQER